MLDRWASKRDRNKVLRRKEISEQAGVERAEKLLTLGN
jgi:hypothetical protein